MFALWNTEIPNSVFSFISVDHQRVNLDFLLRFFHHVQQISSLINIAVNGSRANRSGVQRSKPGLYPVLIIRKNQ